MKTVKRINSNSLRGLPEVWKFMVSVYTGVDRLRRPLSGQRAIEYLERKRVKWSDRYVRETDRETKKMYQITITRIDSRIEQIQSKIPDQTNRRWQIVLSQIILPGAEILVQRLRERLLATGGEYDPILQRELERQLAYEKARTKKGFGKVVALARAM